MIRYWTQDEKDRALAMRAERKTPGEIGAAIGRSKMSVKRFFDETNVGLRKAGLPPLEDMRRYAAPRVFSQAAPPKGPRWRGGKGSPWTEEETAIALQMRAENKSAGQISAALGFRKTRSAVCGFFNRQRASGRAVAPHPRPEVASRPIPHASAPVSRAKATPKPATSAPFRPAYRPPEARPVMTDPEILMSADPCGHGLVTMFDLGPGDCKWPYGDPASEDFRQCGRPQSAGYGPYCCVHEKMAYHPRSHREFSARAARSAGR